MAAAILAHKSVRPSNSRRIPPNPRRLRMRVRQALGIALVAVVSLCVSGLALAGGHDCKMKPEECSDMMKKTMSTRGWLGGLRGRRECQKGFGRGDAARSREPMAAVSRPRQSPRRTCRPAAVRERSAPRSSRLGAWARRISTWRPRLRPRPGRNGERWRDGDVQRGRMVGRPPRIGGRW